MKTRNDNITRAFNCGMSINVVAKNLSEVVIIWLNYGRTQNKPFYWLIMLMWTRLRVSLHYTAQRSESLKVDPHVGRRLYTANIWNRVRDVFRGGGLAPAPLGGENVRIFVLIFNVNKISINQSINLFQA